jgi:hypothetical protein
MVFLYSGIRLMALLSLTLTPFGWQWWFMWCGGNKKKVKKGEENKDVRKKQKRGGTNRSFSTATFQKLTSFF